MSRLSEIFKKNQRCFIPFLTAGHPDLETTGKIVLKLAQSGAHIIEIGIPFSDPIADGPTIQRSSFHALKHNHSFDDYIHLVRRLREKTDAGLIFMTYMNPVLKYGLDRLEREAAAAGLDGILISDLTPEEFSREVRAFRGPSTLDHIFLAAPTSSDDRLKKIAEVTTGFIYLVARTGVTGKHSNIEAQVPKTIRRLRQFTGLPIAVGFGITSAEDVQKVWQYADGAVVGSAIVKFIDENQCDPDLPEKVGEYVKSFLHQVPI